MSAIFAVLLMFFAAVGWSTADALGPAQATTPHNLALKQTASRVRGEFNSALNADTGWAAAINQSAVVHADEPFRIRFEIESDLRPKKGIKFGLEYRRNGGEWIAVLGENFPQPEKMFEIVLRESPEEVISSEWIFLRGTAGDFSVAEEASTITLGEPDGQNPQSSEDSILAFLNHELTWRPTELSGQLRLSDAGAMRAGLAFSYGSQDNYAFVELVQGRILRLIEVTRGEQRVLADAPVQINMSDWNEMVIKIEGRRVTVELSDQEILSDVSLQATVTEPRLGLLKAGPGLAHFRTLLLEGEPRSPITSIVASNTFSHGATTLDVLDFSGLEFVGGSAASFSPTTEPVQLENGQLEVEFPLVIRKFSDNAVSTQTGDIFDYRLIDGDGKPVPHTSPATVELVVPDYHVGGTFVETPMRIGPWQSEDGSLYFMMEPAETWNALMMVRSADLGKSWQEVDSGNRPETGDLEGLGSFFDGRYIHILHQTSEQVVYHAFDTASAGLSGGQWLVTDEHVDSPEEPPTQVADITARSDGSVLGVFADGQALKLKSRNLEGKWSEGLFIDGSNLDAASGPSLVAGKNNVAHLIYTRSNGQAMYRQIAADTRLGDEELISDEIGNSADDVGALLPILYHEEDNSVSVIFRASDRRLYERRRSELGDWSNTQRISRIPVVQNAVDSDQVGADAIVANGQIHVLFVDDQSRQLYYAKKTSEGWLEPSQLTTGMNVQWVRGATVQSKEGLSYGFVLDAGSDGGSGKNKFSEVMLNRE